MSDTTSSDLNPQMRSSTDVVHFSRPAVVPENLVVQEQKRADRRSSSPIPSRDTAVAGSSSSSASSHPRRSRTVHFSSIVARYYNHLHPSSSTDSSSSKGMQKAGSFNQRERTTFTLPRVLSDPLPGHYSDGDSSTSASEIVFGSNVEISLADLEQETPSSSPVRAQSKSENFGRRGSSSGSHDSVGSKIKGLWRAVIPKHSDLGSDSSHGKNKGSHKGPGQETGAGRKGDSAGDVSVARAVVSAAMAKAPRKEEREVKVKSSARVISLLGAATEVIVMLGLEDYLVGCSHECARLANVLSLPCVSAPAIGESKYVSGAAIDEKVRELVSRGLSHYSLDVEKIKELCPDIIITQDACHVCAVTLDDVNAACRVLIQNNSCRVISLKPTTVAEIWDNIYTIANALGHPPRGLALVQSLQSRWAAIKNRMPLGGGDLKRTQVACLQWLDPLMGCGYWVPEIVQVAGGKCVTGTMGKSTGVMSLEQLVGLNPEVIVVACCGYSLAVASREMSVLERRKEWMLLDAVASNRVYIVDGDRYFNNSGPSIVDSAEIMAQILHGTDPGKPSLEGAAYVRWMTDVRTSTFQAGMGGWASPVRAGASASQPLQDDLDIALDGFRMPREHLAWTPLVLHEPKQLPAGMDRKSTGFLDDSQLLNRLVESSSKIEEHVDGNHSRTGWHSRSSSLTHWKPPKWELRSLLGRESSLPVAGKDASASSALLTWPDRQVEAEDSLPRQNPEDTESGDDTSTDLQESGQGSTGDFEEEPSMSSSVETDSVDIATRALQLRELVLQVLQETLPVDCLLLSGGVGSDIVAEAAAALSEDIGIKLAVTVVCGSKSADRTPAVSVAHRVGLIQHLVSRKPLDLLDAELKFVVRTLRTFDPAEVRAGVALASALRHVQSQGFTTVVTGDGAEELFTGYPFMVKMGSAKLKECREHMIANVQYSVVELGRAMGIQVIQPFLHPDIQQFALELSRRELMGDAVHDEQHEPESKFLLKQAFPEIYALHRPRDPVEAGCGTSVLTRLFERRSSPKEFKYERSRIRKEDRVRLRDPEQMFYYRMFRSIFGGPDLAGVQRFGPEACVGCGYPPHFADQLFCSTCGECPARRVRKKARDSRLPDREMEVSPMSPSGKKLTLRIRTSVMEAEGSAPSPVKRSPRGGGRTPTKEARAKWKTLNSPEWTFIDELWLGSSISWAWSDVKSSQLDGSHSVDALLANINSGLSSWNETIFGDGADSVDTVSLCSADQVSFARRAVVGR